MAHGDCLTKLCLVALFLGAFWPQDSYRGAEGHLVLSGHSTQGFEVGRRAQGEGPLELEGFWIYFLILCFSAWVCSFGEKVLIPRGLMHKETCVPGACNLCSQTYLLRWPCVNLVNKCTSRNQ